MTYSVEIKYDRSLIRHALNRYMIKRLGWFFPICVVAAMLGLLFVFISDAWSWIYTVLFVVLASSTAFVIFVYIARLRASESFFDQSSDSAVNFQFTEDGVRTQSQLGASDLNWTVFDEILEFPKVWLLVYAKSGYMTLPLNQLPPEALQFIKSHVTKKVAVAK